MSARKGRRNDVPWLVVGPDPHLATCERCGKQEPPMELPTPLAAATAYFQYVVENHRWCSTPAPAPRSDPMSAREADGVHEGIPHWRMHGDPGCSICAGEGWVCENHAERAWGDGDGCCGGAGMPCPCLGP